MTKPCCNKHFFVSTNTWLSQQNTAFVATKVCLSWKNFCCDKHVILVAAPVNDSESVTQSWDISMPAVLLRHGTGWVGVDNRLINTDNLDKLGCYTYRLACIISPTLWFLSCWCFPQLSRSFLAWPRCAHNNRNNNGYLKCLTCSGPKRYTFFKSINVRIFRVQYIQHKRTHTHTHTHTHRYSCISGQWDWRKVFLRRERFSRKIWKNSNLKTLFYKDNSLGSVKNLSTILPTSPCWVIDE